MGLTVRDVGGPRPACCYCAGGVVAAVAVGALTRNPLTIPSVALAVATAWLAAVVTDSESRYRSDPTVR